LLDALAEAGRLRTVVNSIISGIGLYLLGVVTGLMSGVLTPLAAMNASLALELRSTIDGILHQLDEILGKYKDPYKLALIQEQFFEELGSNLKQTLASVRWYRFFEFWLGLPSKTDVRAAVEKLSEMTRCLGVAMHDGRFDFERRAQLPILGREVKELLKRRRSPF
jgi:hypothetical protein